MSKEEWDEIVQYGLERGKIIAATTGVIVFLGYIGGVFFQSLIFYIALNELRWFAGGYHAKTERRCFLIFFLLLVFSLGFIKYMRQREESHFVLFLVTLFHSALIFFRTLVENQNKFLDKEEQVRFGKKTRQILIGEWILLTFSFSLRVSFIFVSIAAAIQIASLGVLWGQVQKRKFEKDLDGSVQAKDGKWWKNLLYLGRG